MQPEREGNVQQINKKIDNIWEQASQLVERMNSIMEFLQGPRPATPCVDEAPKQIGWLGRTNDRLEHIIVALDECEVLAKHLCDEGFTSSIAPTSGLSHAHNNFISGNGIDDKEANNAS